MIVSSQFEIKRALQIPYDSTANEPEPYTAMIANESQEYLTPPFHSVSPEHDSTETFGGQKLQAKI